jgi:hypothetical protein
VTMTNNAFGWVSERDLTHQCAACYWVLREHRLACCEFARGEFPCAQKCSQYSEEGLNK